MYVCMYVCMYIYIYIFMYRTVAAEWTGEASRTSQRFAADDLWTPGAPERSAPSEAAARGADLGSGSVGGT